jgi:hypothetical protein
MAIGGTVMSLGYSKITVDTVSCPIVLLTGDTETEKSTVLRSCLSLFGDRKLYNRTIICKLLISCFVLFLDYTGKKALQVSTLNVLIISGIKCRFVESLNLTL